ncbi:MAG: FG-GAP repeat protein, partial [Planctomycetota bacterium]
YLASEIGRAGNITDLSLEVTTVPPQVLDNWIIRMKHTNISEYSGCSLETDGWTVVYRNNELISDTGWYTFDFQTPFEYNGTDNLLVDFSHNNSSSTNNGLCRVSSPGGKRSVYAESDSRHGDPLDWPAMDSPTMNCSSNVPNVKLTLTSESIAICGDIKLIASDGGTNDRFGLTVSISGHYAIVGANGNDYKRGAAYIFKRKGTNWVQQAKLTAFPASPNDYFGCSVSISWDYAIVGARGDDGSHAEGYGAAYIFKRNGTSWTQETKLTASDRESFACFGDSVSINGDYVIVGTPYDNDDNQGYNVSSGYNYGAAYIFKRNGTSWTEQTKLTASDGAPTDCFGGSVSISGDYAVAASEFNYDPYRQLTGAVYVFKRDGTSWTQQAKLRALDGSMVDSFGHSRHSISISGDYVAVGANGSTYIFGREGTNWTQHTKLTGLEGSKGDSVLISGDYIIVGAPYDDGDDIIGINYGSAYLFKRIGADWIQQTKLTAFDGAAQDMFGSSVAIDGDYIIVGAIGDDDNGSYSGSAYIFKLDCINLIQQ